MILLEIPPIDQVAAAQARRRLDNLTKPQGSLGRLEELACRMAGMKGEPIPSIQRKVVFTVAGDHGVAREGVSAYPPSVTAQMVINFLKGGAGINVLARHAGAEVFVVDAGVALEFPPMDGLIPAKVRFGTGNFAREPAMTRQEAERIVEIGMRIFQERHQSQRIDLVGLGDMGIGNTTASSALTAVFTKKPVSQVTGRGTGLNEEMFLRKVRVIERALDLHRPDPNDPIGCLAAVGGLEIGCLAGITLAAALNRVPVVLDGFITSAAACLACQMVPSTQDYLIASHQSVEPGHRVLLEFLGLKPLLDLELRLGEGTGAALGFLLIESALKILSEMATFEDAGVDRKIP